MPSVERWAEAVEESSLPRMRAMIDAGQDVDVALDDFGSVALHVACRVNRVDAVRLLLSAGASVDAGASNNIATPLLVASHRGFTTIARELLAAQANIEAVLRDGRTPLLVACQHRHLGVTQMLLRYGATRAPTSHPHDAESLARVRPDLVAAAGSRDLANDHGMAQLKLRQPWSREQLREQRTSIYRREFFDATSVHDWLRQSRSWTTTLHHLEMLAVEEVRALLSADPTMLYMYAKGSPDGPTPLARALELIRRREARQRQLEAAGNRALVLQPHVAVVRVVIARWRWLKAYRLVSGLCGAWRRAADRLFAPGGRGYHQHAASFAQCASRQTGGGA